MTRDLFLNLSRDRNDQVLALFTVIYLCDDIIAFQPCHTQMKKPTDSSLTTDLSTAWDSRLECHILEVICFHFSKFSQTEITLCLLLFFYYLRLDNVHGCFHDDLTSYPSTLGVQMSLSSTSSLIFGAEAYCHGPNHHRYWVDILRSCRTFLKFKFIANCFLLV